MEATVDAGAGQTSPAGVLQGETLRRTATWADPAAIPHMQKNVDANAGQPAWRPAKVRDATVAIVGYGPSLRDTLGELRELAAAGVPVWTCSKAHDVLLEAGITPTRHTDVEFRPHKASYITRYRPEIEYAFALHVAPGMFERARADGASPVAFGVPVPGLQLPPGFKSPARDYPHLQWLPDAGMAIIGLAAALGYRDQHWFGIDAGLGRGGETHAGAHHGLKSNVRAVRLGTETWMTNELLIREALVAEELLRAAPRPRATIHGDGFLRAFLLARKRVTIK